MKKIRKIANTTPSNGEVGFRGLNDYYTAGGSRMVSHYKINNLENLRCGCNNLEIQYNNYNLFLDDFVMISLYYCSGTNYGSILQMRQNGVICFQEI